MSQMSDHKMVEQYARDYNDKIQVLWDKLMGLELQLVDQLEVIYVLELGLNGIICVKNMKMVIN